MTKYQKTYEADPERCQAVTPLGQCINKASEGNKFCPKHKPQRKEINMPLRNYRLAKAEMKEGAERHASSTELKSLREEIALIRTMAERRLNMIDSNADFMTACGQVNTLFLTLEKLINTCHRMEVNVGELLSKAALVEVAKEIGAILNEELAGVDHYEEIIDRIMEKIVASISEQEQR